MFCTLIISFCVYNIYSTVVTCIQLEEMSVTNVTDQDPSHVCMLGRVGQSETLPLLPRIAYGLASAGYAHAHASRVSPYFLCMRMRVE